MQYTMLWEGKMSKTSKILSTKQDRGAGTIYQIKAAAINSDYRNPSSS